MEKISSSAKKVQSSPPQAKDDKGKAEKTGKSFSGLLEKKGEGGIIFKTKKEIIMELEEKEFKTGTSANEDDKEESDQKLEGFAIPRVISEKSGAESTKGVSGIENASLKLDENLINKIVESSKIIRKGDAASMEISIKSDVFENLKLIITSEGNGIKTEFITDNPHLKELIKDSMANLEKSLHNRGLEVLSMVVNDAPPASDAQKHYEEYRRSNETR